MDATARDLVRRFDIQRVRDGQTESAIDTVAIEEPLEIRVAYWFKDVRQSGSLAVTMRTPGADRELITGLLLSEGVIQGSQDIVEVRSLGAGESNEIMAELAAHVDFEGWRLARNTVVNSSCGVCGKRIGQAMFAEIPMREKVGAFRITARMMEKLPKLIHEWQKGFEQTGGLHAAALVDANGEIENVFEDIGRHNALDKLIGWCVLQGRIPLRERLIFMSSRSSFELIQKTVMAGAPALASVGGPSSLAIEMARQHNLTLLGFVRDSRFNIYSGAWRVNSD